MRYSEAPRCASLADVGNCYLPQYGVAAGAADSRYDCLWGICLFWAMNDPQQPEEVVVLEYLGPIW